MGEYETNNVIFVETNKSLNEQESKRIFVFVLQEVGFLRVKDSLESMGARCTSRRQEAVLNFYFSAVEIQITNSTLRIERTCGNE